MEKIMEIKNLPFLLNDEMAKRFFSELPEEITKALDEDVEEGKKKVFEYVICDILGFDNVEEYYESDIFKNYEREGAIIDSKFLFERTKKFIANFEVTFFDHVDEDGQDKIVTGNFGICAKDEFVAKKASMFSLIENFFNNGYSIKSAKILNVTEKNPKNKE